MKILIVDDSVSVRKALEKILLQQAFEVFLAEHAEKALEMMLTSKPDLIIADVVMPGMTGFDLCQQLKKDEAYKHIPLMLISGIVNTNVETQAHQVGALGVIKKPFTPEEIIPKIKGALRTAKESVSQVVQTPEPSIEPAARSQAFETPKAESKPEVKPVPKVKPAIAKTRVTVLGPERQQELSRAFTPILEKTDVLAVLLSDEAGHCLMNLGQELYDKENLAAYIKFLTSASSVLGENLGDTDLKSLVLEYAQRCVVVSRIQGIGVALILKDMTGLSVARYVLKKVTPEISDILEGKVAV